MQVDILDENNCHYYFLAYILISVLLVKSNIRNPIQGHWMKQIKPQLDLPSVVIKAHPHLS